MLCYKSAVSPLKSCKSHYHKRKSWEEGWSESQGGSWEKKTLHSHVSVEWESWVMQRETFSFSNSKEMRLVGGKEGVKWWHHHTANLLNECIRDKYIGEEGLSCWGKETAHYLMYESILPFSPSLSCLFPLSHESLHSFQPPCLLSFLISSFPPSLSSFLLSLMF